jgi:hypothetical protein
VNLRIVVRIHFFHLQRERAVDLGLRFFQGFERVGECVRFCGTRIRLEATVFTMMPSVWA